MTMLVALGIGILATVIAFYVLKSRHYIREFRANRRVWRDVALRARTAGLTSLVFSRSDYPQRLPAYLQEAKRSLCIVSVSLHATSSEGQLISLFRNKLRSRDDFEITVSLLAPKSRAVVPASAALGMSREELVHEIQSMLRLLKRLKDDLPPHEASRIRVMVHDALPPASVIVVDGQMDIGRIQVETKLFQAPRTESFGYEVRGPGEFYRRHYRATLRMLNASRPTTKRDID